MATFVSLLVRFALLLAPLAAPLGSFIGAVLAECGPVLSEILAHAIRAAFSDSVEDGARRPDGLRTRLRELVQNHKNRTGPSGGPDPNP